MKSLASKLLFAVIAMAVAGCNGAPKSTSTVASSASASNPPSSCIDKSNYELAYRQNVLYSIHQAGYTAVGYSAITQTSADFHDPEYDVKVDATKTVHVTCDDSGDDQCYCEIAAP